MENMVKFDQRTARFMWSGQAMRMQYQKMLSMRTNCKIKD